ncbi:Beta-lactamase superfamily domain protein [Candidatus Burarchaeum australiense]|nr:Beta-lactamase superfamily domain protein [Candidatus Burarchaeum australiense]
MKLTYVGHSTFKIELGGLVILMDPFFSGDANGRPRKVAAALSPGQIRECDFIFISHEHTDHCDVAAIQEIVERTHAQVVAPRPVLAKLELSERRRVDVKEGDKFEIKGLNIDVIKAVHPQSTYPVGYKLSMGGQSVYFAGDTYEYRDMKDITADVAIVPIGGSYTMDTFAASTACNEMNIKYAIPMHYNTHDRIEQFPEEFAKDVKKAKVVILEPGEDFEF